MRGYGAIGDDADLGAMALYPVVNTELMTRMSGPPQWLCARWYRDEHDGESEAARV